MKQYLKAILNSRIYSTLAYLRNKRFFAYSLISQIFPREKYSDFFVYATKYKKNIMVVENIFSLYYGKKITVTHVFRFYNSIGIKIKEFKYKDDNLFSEIVLPSIQANESYLSFTHETIEDSSESFVFKNIRKNNIVAIHHRGYTIYKKKNDSLGSVVHGNFGGICPNEIKASAARKGSKMFQYTPVFLFNSKDEYDLVFNNPTQNKLKVNIMMNSSNTIKVKEICIKPFGTISYRLNNYSGSISFISYLPICRCIVFKNPEIDSSNFDVFHS